MKPMPNEIATSKVYNELMKHIPITHLTLRKRVEKTNKVYKLFKGVGVEKIERINETTANEISTFSLEQIDLIIANITSN
ncbi:8212_t:CDS:2 [Scutellospora calospora]|uniref:8212_t:CDS:1 n=1 Tax=Scutellospora calospora TaxID=85575 RepID=A0ACA9LWI8_9GLOM|nr:8212_t:CDS:2 [Scutellospora calospora]